MNREIKFRAFVRGYMVNVVSIDFVNQYITWDDNQYDRCDPPNKCYEMESFSAIKLMQFTGLHDKNGKEIYEGDIVQCGYGTGGVVLMCGCFMVRWIDDSQAQMEMLGLNKKMRRMREDEEQFEVIGNVFKHPNMLAVLNLNP